MKSYLAYPICYGCAAFVAVLVIKVFQVSSLGSVLIGFIASLIASAAAEGLTR